MTDRKILLGRLMVGDLFHATGPTGASLICLTVAITPTTIQARRITTQETLKFDRQTGVECDDRPSRIDSIAPLPPPILNTLLELDRRYGLQQSPEQGRLTDSEIHALGTYAGPHYASNPL